jgi:P4 family phage/plasmid primase-like protien
MSDKTTVNMYRSKKINCVPIPKGSGKAMNFKWKQYQTEFCTLNISEDQDFGVICGESSNNLIVIDLDHISTIDVFDEVFPEIGSKILDQTLVVQSGNGFHIYLRVEGTLPQSSYLQKNINGKTQALEIKSQGNYVVGASSDHYENGDNGYFPSGKTYRVISTTEKIKTVNGDIIAKLNGDGWYKQGESGDVDLGNADTQDILRRGGWSGGSRHNNGFKVALWSYSVDEKTDEEVLQEAMDINATCNPPKPKGEVERWCAGAREQFEKNQTNGFQKNFSHAKHVAETEKKAQEKQDQIEKVTDALRAKFRFATYTDTEELMVWNGRYYNSIGAEYTVKEAVEQVDGNAQQALVNEVLAKIKRSTGRLREDFNRLTKIIDGKEVSLNSVTLENGILNLDSLAFREHTPQNYTTWNIPVNWNEDTSIEDPVNFDAIETSLHGTVFWKYIKECFQENRDAPVIKEDVFTVMETMAYILHNDNELQKTIMFIGSGSNGKTKLLEYIDDLFGKRNTTHISIQELSEGGFILAQLDGKLANICADVESTELRRTGKLKQLIGGEGVEVSKKYQHPYTLRSRSKFIFSANRFPITLDQTDGFFRRYIILQWKRKFDGANKDTELGRKLRENESEKSLVFHVLVHMARNLKKRGDFKHTKSVNEVRTNWNNLADPIQMFINDELEDVAGNNVSKKEMFQAYSKFCLRNELQPLRIGTFGRVFREMYDDTTLREGQQVGKVWCDVRIKPDTVTQGELDKY